jgi:hypothetical protein
MSASSFERLLKAGELPMVEELQPRIGHERRFRADLIDRYVAGTFGTVRQYLGSHRRRQPTRASAQP